MKKGIVFCEGIDDIAFLGYYLYKKSKGCITRINKETQAYVSREYNLNVIKANEISYYKDHDRRFALCAMGGKTAIMQGVQGLFQMIIKKYINVEERITHISIVMDRDEQDIEETLFDLEQSFQKIFSDDMKFTNNTISEIHFEDESHEEQIIKILPIIIPFDEYGCIESLLMHAQAEKGSNEKEIVRRADEYVNSIMEDGIAEHYLTHKRFIVKAKFSSMVAIVNPDHSTRTMNSMLIDYSWELNPVIDCHFSVLYEMIHKEYEKCVV